MKHIPLSKEYLRGVHHLEEYEQGVMLQRFPAAVLQLYDEMPGRLLRAQSPAGVRIVFKTDSRHVTLSYVFGRASRDVYAFSAFVDGEKVGYMVEDGIFSLELGGGDHTVEIEPPHLVECYFGTLGLDDDAQIAPAAPVENLRRLLFVGDSIMQGMTTSEPALAYADQLARAGRMDYVNAAIAGNAADPRVTRLIAGEYMYDCVIFCLGVNDFYMEKSLDEYKRDLAETVAPFAGTPMVMISMTPVLNRPQVNGKGEMLDMFREAVRELAQQRPDTVFVDGLRMIPAEETYFVDGLHPSDAGATCFFKNLSEIVLG